MSLKGLRMWQPFTVKVYIGTVCKQTSAEVSILGQIFVNKNFCKQKIFVNMRF